jgi:hypothetical protein
MPPPSRLTASPDAWDLILADDEDDTNPLTLMLVQDADVALWEGADAPSLASDQSTYREQAVMWKQEAGAGYSRRTEDVTGAGPDGQIISFGTSYGRNVCLAVPGVAMPAGKVTEVEIPAGAQAFQIGDSAEYGGDKDLYLTTTARTVIKIAGGNGVVSYQDLGPTFLSLEAQIFDGKLYISGGITGGIWEYDGTSWTQAGAQCQATHMERVNWLPSNAVMGGSGGGTPADHLILTDGSRTGFFHVVEGNDPKVFANWIGNGGLRIKVGDPQFLIQDIVASPHVIWFSKPNGLHGYTEIGRAPNLTPWIERAFSEENGFPATFYSDDDRAFVFYAHAHGLLGVAVNGNQQEASRLFSFGGRTPNETPIWGRPRAYAEYVDGLYVAYFDGTDSYVMRLILEKDGSYRWSGAEMVIEGEEVSWMRVTSPGGLPRLWVATTGGTPSPRLYWMSLPESGNPWIDYVGGLGHRFATNWSVDPPRDDCSSAANKVVRRYDIVARNVAEGNAVTVSASADDGAYVDQGTVVNGPRASFIANTYPTGVNFNWRLSCQNTETNPIVLETFQARMSVLPEQSDVWTFRCQLAAGEGLLNGAESLLDPYAVRARLRAFQRRGPIQMRRSPLSRETLTVKVEPGMRLQAIKSRKTDEMILVVTFSVSVLSQPAIWGVDVYSVGEYGLDE